MVGKLPEAGAGAGPGGSVAQLVYPPVPSAQKLINVLPPKYLMSEYELGRWMIHSGVECENEI